MQHGDLASAQVLACLNPISLLRLGACSKQLQTIVSTSAVWELLCSEQGLTRQPFKDSYCAWRRTLCVECQQPTRYCFKLLGVRLCMACEHKVCRAHLMLVEQAYVRTDSYAVCVRPICTGHTRPTCKRPQCLHCSLFGCVHAGLRRPCANPMPSHVYCPQHPRYGLVTEEEARERYCLSDDVLAELESVTSCGLELYLRSAGGQYRLALQHCPL